MCIIYAVRLEMVRYEEKKIKEDMTNKKDLKTKPNGESLTSGKKQP